MKKRYSKTIFPENNVKVKKAIFENFASTPGPSKEKPVIKGSINRFQQFPKDGSSSKNDNPIVTKSTEATKTIFTVDGMKHEVKLRKKVSQEINNDTEMNSQMVTSNPMTRSTTTSSSGFTRTESIEKGSKTDSIVKQTSIEDNPKVLQTQLSNFDLKLMAPKIIKGIDESFGSTSISIAKQYTNEDVMKKETSKQEMKNPKILKSQFSAIEIQLYSPTTENSTSRSTSFEEGTGNEVSVKQAIGHITDNRNELKTQLSSCEIELNSPTTSKNNGKSFGSRTISIDNDQVIDNRKELKTQLSTFEIKLNSPTTPRSTDKLFGSGSISTEEGSRKEDSMKTEFDYHVRSNKNEYKTQMSSIEIQTNSPTYLKNIEEQIIAVPTAIEKRSYDVETPKEETERKQITDEGKETEIVISEKDSAMEFFKGYLETIDSFQVPEKLPNVEILAGNDEEEEYEQNEEEEEEEEEYEVRTPISGNDPDMEFFQNCLSEIDKYDVKKVSEKVYEEENLTENKENNSLQDEGEYELRTPKSGSDPDKQFFQNCLDEIGRYEVKVPAKLSADETLRKHDSIQDEEYEDELNTPTPENDPDIAFFKNCLEEIDKYEIIKVLKKLPEEENLRENLENYSSQAKEEKYELENNPDIDDIDSEPNQEEIFIQERGNKSTGSISQFRKVAENFDQIYEENEDDSDFDKEFEDTYSRNQIVLDSKVDEHISEKKNHRESIKSEKFEDRAELSKNTFKVKENNHTEICENADENPLVTKQFENTTNSIVEKNETFVETISGNNSTESYFNASDELYQETSTLKETMRTKHEKISKISYSTSNTSKDFYQENITLKLSPIEIVETRLQTSSPNGVTSESYQETITTHGPTSNQIVETKILFSDGAYQESRNVLLNADSQLIGMNSTEQKELKIRSEPYAGDRQYQDNMSPENDFQENAKSNGRPQSIDFGANKISNVTNEMYQESRNSGESKNDRQGFNKDVGEKVDDLK